MSKKIVKYKGIVTILLDKLYKDSTSYIVPKTKDLEQLIYSIKALLSRQILPLILSKN